MVELLKQEQYRPYDIADQVIVIWAGTKGYLDKVPVDKVREVERGFLDFIHSTHREILDGIHKENDISEQTERRLVSVIEEFRTKTLAGKAPDPRADRVKE